MADVQQLWRIHIRPGGGRADPVSSYSLCLREHVIGVGWQVEHHSQPLTMEEYLRLGAETYGDEWGSGRSAVGLLAAMEANDLVWMRSPHGVYHLCKVIGPWRYRDSSEYQDADIVNVRPVEIVEAGVSAHVPGKVIACFRPSRAVQRIVDDTALAYSQVLWSRLTNESVPQKAHSADLFSLISSEDCEDLVYVYLQVIGWIVYPAQRQSDTLAYEFVLRNRRDFREAVVQVKTGWSPVDLSTLPETIEAAFAFQPNGQYIGDHPRAVIISRDELLKFIELNPRLVPPTVSLWISEGVPDKP